MSKEKTAHEEILDELELIARGAYLPAEEVEINNLPILIKCSALGKLKLTDEERKHVIQRLSSIVQAIDASPEMEDSRTAINHLIGYQEREINNSESGGAA